MTAEQALAALKDARDGRKGWLRIAEILEQVREGAIGGHPGKLSGAFITEAAGASRYTPVILRRMVAARSFLISFDREHPGLRFRELLDGSTAQFSKLELFARLYRTSPAKALEIANEVAGGFLTTKALDLIYREAAGRPLPGYLTADPLGGIPALAAARPVGARRLFATPFHAACWEALKTSIERLSGEGDIRLSCDYRLTYFSPFAIAVGMKEFGIEFVDGFHPVLLTAPAGRNHLNRVLKEISFQAPFFRRFWVLLPSDEATTAMMCNELTSLGLESIGCAELENGTFEVRRQASAMATIQRQAKLAAEVLEVGVPRG